MKYIKEYIEENLRIRALGEISTNVYESSCGDYTGEELCVDGIPTNIIIYYIDYINWLENDFLNRY